MALGAALVAFACLAAAGLVSMPAPPASEVLHRAQALPPGYDLLLSVLDERRRCLLATDRVRLLETIAGKLPTLLPPLLWLLEQPDHQRFGDAAQLAADFKIEEAVDLVAVVAWGPAGPQRTAALAALDRLRPLDDAELLELLQQGDAELARTGMQLLGSRVTPSTALLQALVELLRHPADQVRAAALQRFPDELPDALAADLLGLLDDPTAGPSALKLLGRLAPTPASIEAIARRLAGSEPDEQLALLATIERYAAAAPVRRILWDLAVTPDGLELQAAALHCLERAGVDQPLPRDAASWPPLLRLHGARLRIRAGHHDGIDTLLELAAAVDEEGRAVRGQARLLLSRLANLPPHASLQAFDDWHARLTNMPAVDLPAPGR